MDFKEWFLSLSDDDRERYARDAGTTAGYIRVHLIGRRKIPRPDLLRRLAEASNGKFSPHGKFTVGDLLGFFYKAEERIDASVNDDSVAPRAANAALASPPTKAA